MSVEMGLLPAGTVITHPPKKRKAMGNLARQIRVLKPGESIPDFEGISESELEERKPKYAKKKKIKLQILTAPIEQENEEEEEDEESEEEMEPPTDPEETLVVGNSHLTTVFWDPDGLAEQKIGWRIRVAEHNSNAWHDGRVVRYDPCTHKHKIKFSKSARQGDTVDKDNCVWLHLRMEDGIQMATRIVWAHVKGYAWWPAMIMESDITPPRDGYVQVEFFGSGEVATLRDSPESVRPFDHGKVDGVIAKNKKKRNAAAIGMAIDEETAIAKIRNEAAKYYAEMAYEHNVTEGDPYVGKKVQLFRDDINYPYGDTCIGRVRQYSKQQGKWLVTYELTNKTRKKYDASWVNLLAKEHKVRMLDKKIPLEPPTEIDISPFIVGFTCFGTNEKDPSEGTDAFMEKVLTERCRGCSEYWKTDSDKLTCKSCKGSVHPACADPPVSQEQLVKMARYGEEWTCAKCTPCRGCYQKDICFGSHAQTVPKTLTFPHDESLDLCSMCVTMYDEGQFCPNCAHSWDDDHFQHVQRQIRWQQAHRPKKRGRKRKSELEDPTSAPDFQSFTAPATIHVEEPLPLGASVNPAWYHPETSQWGYTEVDMLTCDSCKLWVHAGCAGVTEDEYNETSDGDHPIYSKEFLCRSCCRQRAADLIQKFNEEDKMGLFAAPVNDRDAPNYFDVIKRPMDLQTMAVRAEKEDYKNYAWVREMCELMILNALTFNRHHSPFWKEAKRFHEKCLGIFKSSGKGAPPGQYADLIEQNYLAAKDAVKLEEERVQEDKTVEKKDLVAGASVAVVKLPSLRREPPDLESCLPYTEVKLKPIDGHYCSWMDSCFTCGSTGASDTMLFCVDCGESFHSFCVNAPIHSMEASSVAGWRCPNCKICEISGETCHELKMLFCEMCDRGFSLDLLEPPLKAAPPGLWICGQCVDCKKCDNTSEPQGQSLTYWSRNPQLCYRCGGCDGLVDDYKKKHKCPVCSGVWRESDKEMAECSNCGSKVHKSCDSEASLYLKKIEAGVTSAKYQCPGCCKRHGVKKGTDVIHRGHLHALAWKSISEGVLQPDDEVSRDELHSRLVNEIDWSTRNLWRDDYRRVVLEGIRIMSLATTQFGEPRLLMDRFWEENIDLPPWMGHRATRFLQVAKKLQMDSTGYTPKRIDQCVLTAKLAASWLKVACRTMGIRAKKSVKGYDRAMKLLKAPQECGTVELPFDSIRHERNPSIICKEEWSEKFDPELQTSLNGNGSRLHVSSNGKKKALVDFSKTLVKPLCGWNGELSDESGSSWRDTRACCLCHQIGDDDAGLPDEPPPEGTTPHGLSLPRLGRLLPMGEGHWVHSACALWSSETWEASTDGLINAVEKARSRGSQLRCFGCGQNGATVGCVKSNCSCNYHFPCAFASNCAFTTKKQVYCSSHKDFAEDKISHPSVEHMKTLIVAPDKKSEQNESADESLCCRVGALTVHSFGEIEQALDGFHSVDYITPPGFVATRIFWSSVIAKARTVYILMIEKTANNRSMFSIIPGDNPSGRIRAPSADQAYETLMEKVSEAQAECFSHGDHFSKLPIARRSRSKTFGLNGPQVSFSLQSMPISSI